MTEIILTIVLILFVVTAAGAFVYFLYFPFRMLLLKSGKLKRKLDKQINVSYLLLLCTLSVLMFCFRNYRTSSQDRLEENAQVKLPENFAVIKDEYTDLTPDYAISFHIRFSSEATKELTERIRKSRFYNSDLDPDVIIRDSVYHSHEKTRIIWCRSPNGYRFDKKYQNIFYSIDLDTTSNILKYSEDMI